MKKTPERTSRAVFEHDAEVWSFCTSSEEEHYIWVPDDFHHCTFIFEFLKFILFNNLLFDFFDGHCGELPSSSVYDSIASFGQLSVIMELVKWDLIVLVEDSVVVHHVHKALVLIHDACSDLLLDVLLVGSRLLKLAEHFPLVLREHSDGLLLFFAEAFLQVITSIIISSFL